MRYALSLGFLFAAAPVAAQAKSDPLSGTWSGYIGRSEADPAAVTFEFKLGSNKSVTGTASSPRLSPGEIVRGSFDPASGALRFGLVIQDGNGAGAEVTFDGRVVGDSATGTLAMGDQRGIFKLARGAGNPVVLKSPGPPSGDVGAALRRGFVEVSDWVTRAAELVPAERYSYKPAATVRTFAQLVGHIVDGANYYCGRAAGKNVEWQDPAEKTMTTKAALTQALKLAMAACLAVYDAGGGQAAPLLENIGHTSLHYGNAITYLRMMGLVPPSS